MLKNSASPLGSILVQILIWIVLGNVLLFYQPFLRDIAVPYEFWVKQTFILLMLVAAYYINANVLVPKFLLRKRTGVYFLILFVILFLVVFLAGFADRALHIRHLLEEAFHRNGPPKGGRGGRDRGYFDTFTIVLTSLVLGISTSVNTMQDWQKNQRLQKEMEAEKISSELSFLKAQINPHFFFNTLNNIYALTLVNVETSRTALHQLSRMMRYVLYDTQNTTALLSGEIAFVKDYISLMQLRLTDKVTVDYASPASLSERPIAPMLFLPFVENAFKHGLSDTQPSTITVHITQEAEQVTLFVKNGIFKKQGADLEANKGIGLNNTIRRLELLYPGRYVLDVHEDKPANQYMVKLKIMLA